MSDLVEFLLARITEDENGAHQVLRDYAEHSATWDNPCTGVINIGDPGLEGLVALGDGPLAIHIADWDPARVLAECDAKRRIFKIHSEIVTGDIPTERAFDFCNEDLEQHPCPTLRLLALPYAEHPDYRDEWRP